MIQPSIVELSRKIESKQLSPVQLTETALAAAHGAGATHHAFTQVLDERAVHMARAAEARMMAGARIGPLDGVPVTVKDLLTLAGTVTTNGSGSGWETGGEASSATVASLERAGAVIIGKNNLHELAMGITNDNPHFGATGNPWNPSVSPGGSSGGSGAALALGIGFGSVGTDTGGSIRVPAAACGVFGLKPTFGCFSTKGVSPISWSLDHVGPMARRADDLAVMHGAMGASTSLDDLAGVRRDLTGLRIGVPQNYFTRRVESAVAAGYQASLDALADLGAVLVEVTVPDFDDAVAAAFILSMVEAPHAHRTRIDRHADSLGDDVREFLRSGDAVSSAAYVDALQSQGRYRTAMNDVFSSVDVLATPTLPATPKPFGTESVVIDGTSEPLFNCMIRLTCPFNITGHPALSAPCPVLADDLPCAVQLVGPPASEPLLLRLAILYDEATLAPHHNRVAALDT